MYQFYEKYVQQFNIFDTNNENNYILIYSDDIKLDHKICTIIRNIDSISNYKLIKVLYPYQKSVNTNYYEQFIVDDYTENNLIFNAKIIIYLSTKKSINENFIDFVQNNNKPILYNIKQIDDTTILKINADEYKNDEFINIYNTYGNISLESNIKFNIQYNIKIVENKRSKYEESYLNLITYFKSNEKLDNTLQEQLYKTQYISLCENFKNKSIKRYIIYGNNLDKLKIDLQKILELKKIEKEIIFIDGVKTIILNDIVQFMNKNYNNQINLFIKSDIIVPYQDSLESLEYFYNNPENRNIIYSISSFIRSTNGNLIKNKTYMEHHCSTEQDMYIFWTPITFDKQNDNKNNDNNLVKSNNDFINKLNIFNKLTELFINHDIINNNYILFNDTINFKIIRFMLNDDQIENRIIYDNNNITFNDIKECKDIIYFLPENQLTNNININLNGTYMDCYKFKCNFVNKIMKDNIFK